MKKILFISYGLPPLLCPQSIQVGRFLKILKTYDELEIVILTADDNSNLDEELYPDILNGLEVVKVEFHTNKYISYIKNRFLCFFYHRPDIFKSWMKKSYKKITSKYKKNDFDIILSFSHPLSTNILGKMFKNYFGCKWIACNSDPWVDNINSKYNSYMLKINERIEKECFSMSDCLVFTSKETSEWYQKKYPEMIRKITYINHSFDRDLFEAGGGGNKKFIIRYIGSFYGLRTPKPLFEAMKSMSNLELSKFDVELIGEGEKTKLLLSKYSLNNVLVKKSVGYLESLKLMKDADCLLVIDAPSNDISVFFPSKLADYIGANKPIIGISPKGATSRILKELGYSCFELDDIEGIAREIKYVVNNNIETGKRCDIIEEYNIEKNSKNLKDLIDE